MALVTDGISCAEAAKIGATATTVFADALQSALLRHGESARVGVVTQGADIMATFKTKASVSNEVPFLDRFAAELGTQMGVVRQAN